MLTFWYVVLFRLFFCVFRGVFVFLSSTDIQRFTVLYFFSILVSGHPTVTSGLPSAKILPLDQTSIYALDQTSIYALDQTSIYATD